MKNAFQIFVRFILISGFTAQVSAREKSTPELSRPLVLTEAIPLAGVQGRFDHFGFDRKNQLFVAALGNNSVELIDISARTRGRSITGIPNPRASSTETKKLFAARPMTLEHNFPMALDEANRRLFVATHEPPRLAVFDTSSGRSVAALP